MIEKEKVEKIIQDFIGVKIARLNNEEKRHKIKNKMVIQYF